MITVISGTNRSLGNANKMELICGQFLLIILLSSAVSVGKAQQYSDSLLAARQTKIQTFLADPAAPLGQEDAPFLHYYDPDVAYRVEGVAALLLQEQPFRMPTSDGTSKLFVRYARIQFNIGGEEVGLVVYRSADPFINPMYKDHLFLPFTDPTNGFETYSGGRYLDLSVSDIRNGRVVIDFNNAYNPYCAYASGYRCPIPPKENNLAIPINAGEKRYTGPMRQRPEPGTR